MKLTKGRFFVLTCGIKLFFVGLATIASAETTTVTPPSPEAQLESAQSSICASLGQLASEIMTKRQDGFAMSSLMGSVREGTAATKMMKSMIILAYTLPRWGFPESQATAIADFRNETELGCYNDLK